MKKKEIIICIIILVLSITSITIAITLKENRKVVNHIRRTSTDIKSAEEVVEKNNTESLQHPINYDSLEKELMGLVNNEGYSIIKRDCEEKTIKSKTEYIKTDNIHMSTKSIPDLLEKLKKAQIVVEQEESNVCPSIAYYVASDNEEELQVFYSTDQTAFVVKVNGISYNFKYENEKEIKNFLENLK